MGAYQNPSLLILISYTDNHGAPHNMLRDNKMYKLLIIFFLVMQSSLCVTQKLPIQSDIWPPQTVIWNLKNGHKLIYVASHHTQDINSAVHQVIKKIFENEKPDVYIMEGFSAEEEGDSPDRLKQKSTKLCEVQKKCGEGMYAAYLATKHNINFIGADLFEKHQIPLLKAQGYSRKDVIFFMLIQSLPNLYGDGDWETRTQKFTPDNWESMCNHHLQKHIAKWIDDKVTLTYQDFLAWWQDNFKEPLDMKREFSSWDKGINYCHSNHNDDALYSQKIANWFHKNRDDHMFKIIQETVANNKTTLAVFGSGHLRDEWDRLVEAFGEPSSRENIEGAYIWDGG